MKWYSHKIPALAFLFPILYLCSPLSAASAQVSLQSCIIAARNHHPSLEAARAATREAQTLINIANTQFGPHLDLSASSRINSVIPEITTDGTTVDTPAGSITVPGLSRELGDYDTYSIDLKIQQIIYAGGRIKGNVSRAELAADAAAAAEPVRRLELDRRVAMTYLLATQMMELEVTAENTLKLSREHRDDVLNLYESGVVLQNEVMKAELRVSEAENNLINARNRTAVQLERLKILTGLDLDMKELSPDTLKIDITADQLRIIQSVADEKFKTNAFRQAFENRPELTVFDAGIEQFEHEIEMIRRERLPTVTAFGQASYGKPGPDFPQNDWIDSYQAGIQMHVNLWDYGRRDSREAKLVAAVERIRTEKEAAKSEIEQSVVEAIIGIRDAGARLTVTERAVGQAEMNFRLTADRFEEGTVTNTDYLDAEIALANARNRHIIARTGLHMAYIKYSLAIGTNLAPEDQL